MTDPNKPHWERQREAKYAQQQGPPQGQQPYPAQQPHPQQQYAQHPQGAPQYQQQQYAQHPQDGQQYQQPHPQQQYAPQHQRPMQRPYPRRMYPPPPPPKSNKALWFLVLFLCGVIALPVVGILALAAIPLITSNTRDAKRAEGEELLGSCRNMVRAAYAKTNTAPSTLTSAGVSSMDRTGEYFTVDDRVTSTSAPVSGYSSSGYGGSGYGSSSSGSGSLTCSPNQNPSDGTGTMTFNWADGNSEMTWNPK